MSIKVSVIIPIYNGEKYLKQCIDALLCQTLHDIEIIIVNDGSKDKSSEIAHEMAKEDNRIIVIDKCNEGVSVARNAGLEIANGEWIAFSDVDDYYTPDGLFNLYQVAMDSKCKVILGNTNRIAHDGAISHRYPNMIHGQVYDVFPVGSLEMWGDLFHRSLFQSAEYIFTPGLAYLEDRLLMVKLLSREGQYSACSVPVYTHVKNDDSVLESKNGLRMARHCFWASELMSEFANIAKNFREDVLSNAEQAKLRGASYFLQKKNAPFSELVKTYQEFFPNDNDIYRILLKVKWNDYKNSVKRIIKLLIRRG